MTKEKLVENIKYAINLINEKDLLQNEILNYIKYNVDKHLVDIITSINSWLEKTGNTFLLTPG